MRKRVLIVEDQVDLARFMGHRLAMAEYEPLIAHSGKEGLEILQEKEMDLLITDVVMPEMDGHTLCKVIRASKNFAELPIIVSSAYPDREAEFKDLKIEDFLIKPVEPDKLIETVSNVLGSSIYLKKHKLILFEHPLDAGIQMAVKQFRDMGFHIDIEVINDRDDIIREVLRHQPDIFIARVMREKGVTAGLVGRLRGYVLIKEMHILLYDGEYFKSETNRRIRHKKEKELKSCVAACVKAGATEYIEDFNREAFLSVLFKYCKG